MGDREVREMVRLLRPILGLEADQTWSAYILSDALQRVEIEHWLQILSNQLLGDHIGRTDTLLPPPTDPQSACGGDYELGVVMYNNKALCKFGLREHEWLSHAVIVGRSGSGKTNTVLQILNEFIRHGKPFWIFDFKRNYRDLTKEHPGKIQVFTVGRDVAPFAFNPLTPGPGESRSSRSRHMTEWIRKAFQIRDGAESLIQKALTSIDSQHGTLEDVEERLQGMPVAGRQAQWHVTATRAIRAINTGALGHVFASNGPPIHALLRQNIIFELDGLTQKERNLFRDALLHARHVHKLASPSRETFQDALIIEEAHHLLRKANTACAEDVLSIALREERELGTAIIVIDQLPSKLSEVAFANTATTVALNQKSKPDIQVLANSLLLSDEEAAGLARLPTGHALIKLQHRPSLPVPVLVKIHQAPISKGFVTDEHLKTLRTPGDFTDFSLQKPSGEGFHEFRTGHKPTSEARLDRTELAFLNDIHRHPASPVTTRYKRLHLNPRKGHHVQQHLIQHDFIKTQRITTQTGATQLLSLTTRARNYLTTTSTTGREGGATHQYVKTQLKQELEREGFTVALEHPIGDGRTIDILATKARQTVAIEIEAGRARHLFNNIKGCLEAGHHHILIVPTCTKILTVVQRELTKNQLTNTVTVTLPKDALRTIQSYARRGEP